MTQTPAIQEITLKTLETLFRRYSNAHFATCADEFREGASDHAVKKRYDLSMQAENAFCDTLKAYAALHDELLAYADESRAMFAVLAMLIDSGMKAPRSVESCNDMLTKGSQILHRAQYKTHADKPSLPALGPSPLPGPIRHRPETQNA